MTDDLRPPYRIQFDNARDPYTARNALGIAPAGGPFQPLDATLTALAAYNTNGLLTQTAPDTFTGRTITGPAAGIAVSNGNGVAGNPTLALADDLAALEALTGTNNIYYRSGASAWTAVTISTGLLFTGGTLTAADATKFGRVATVGFTSSGTWTKNANLIGVTVEVWGGGGAGNTAVAGFGGSGGGYARKWYSASALGSTVTVTIGAGGTAIGNGGTTTFAAAAPISASGGTGGGSPPGSGTGGDINLTGSVPNVGIAGATVGGGGNAPLMSGGGVSGGNPTTAAPNSGGGGTSAGGNGGSGLCIVTEQYSS